MAQLLTVRIAGSQFHRGARETLARLAPGALLRLIREPDNKSDRLAVWDRQTKLGCVPRQNNFKVAWSLDGGTPGRRRLCGLHR
jgi:hypothetical protein